MESFASENDDEVMSGDLEWRYEYCCIGAVEQQWRDRAGAGGCCSMAAGGWLELNR